MKLYRLKSNKLKELHGSDPKKRAFNYEKTIQIMIEKNLDKIFPGLKFLISEYQIEDSRPDTIAFNMETTSFVIIEYKNIKNKGVLDQGMSYYQLLKEKKEAFVLLYQNLTSKSYNVKDINWDETRVIFISPHFTSHQKRASKAMSQIELYEIRQYDDNIISFNKLAWQMAKSQKRREQSILLEHSESDYLAGKYKPLNIPLKTKQIWFKLKDSILETFEKLEFKQMKTYAKFYSRDDNSIICTMQATSRKINLTYSTTKKRLLPKSKFIRDVSKVGIYGIGHYQSEIKNDANIKKAIDLITLVYQDKIRS